MTTWPLVHLGDVLSHRKEFIQIDDGLRYKRCRVQLHAQGIVLRDEVPGIEIKTKAQQVCREGEFLVAEIDAKVGGFGIIPASLEGAIVSSHYFLFTVNSALLDVRFLGYYVKTSSFRDQVTAQGSTNYAAIRPSHVLSYTMPLPPLDEQRRIVERIGAIAQRLSTVQRDRDAVRTEVKTVLLKLRKEPFEHHADRIVRVGDVFRVTTGGTPSRGNPAYWNGTIPWVSSGEVAFCRIVDTREKITELGMRESNAKVYPRATVLLAMIGQGKTRGQCAVLNCEAATNQNVAGIHVYETPHVPEYVYQWLVSQYWESRSSETGTAQPALSGKRVSEMSIPLPPPAEQRRIVAALNVLDRQMQPLQELLDAAEQEMRFLMPSILNKAFSGQL